MQFTDCLKGARVATMNINSVLGDKVLLLEISREYEALKLSGAAVDFDAWVRQRLRAAAALQQTAAQQLKQPSGSALSSYQPVKEDPLVSPAPYFTRLTSQAEDAEQLQFSRHLTGEHLQASLQEPNCEDAVVVKRLGGLALEGEGSKSARSSESLITLPLATKGHHGQPNIYIGQLSQSSVAAGVAGTGGANSQRRPAHSISRRPDWVNAAYLQSALCASSGVPQLQADAERDRRLALSTALARQQHALGISPDKLRSRFATAVATHRSADLATAEFDHIMQVTQHLSKQNGELTRAIQQTNEQLRQQQVLLTTLGKSLVSEAVMSHANVSGAAAGNQSHPPVETIKGSDRSQESAPWFVRKALLQQQQQQQQQAEPPNCQAEVAATRAITKVHVKLTLKEMERQTRQARLKQALKQIFGEPQQAPANEGSLHPLGLEVSSEMEQELKVLAPDGTAQSLHRAGGAHALQAVHNNEGCLQLLQQQDLAMQHEQQTAAQHLPATSEALTSQGSWQVRRRRRRWDDNVQVPLITRQSATDLLLNRAMKSFNRRGQAQATRLRRVEGDQRLSSLSLLARDTATHEPLPSAPQQLQQQQQQQAVLQENSGNTVAGYSGDSGGARKLGVLAVEPLEARVQRIVKADALVAEEKARVSRLAEAEERMLRLMGSMETHLHRALKLQQQTLAPQRQVHMPTQEQQAQAHSGSTGDHSEGSGVSLLELHHLMSVIQHMEDKENEMRRKWLGNGAVLPAGASIFVRQQVVPAATLALSDGRLSTLWPSGGAALCPVLHDQTNQPRAGDSSTSSGISNSCKVRSSTDLAPSKGATEARLPAATAHMDGSNIPELFSNAVSVDVLDRVLAGQQQFKSQQQLRDGELLSAAEPNLSPVSIVEDMADAIIEELLREHAVELTALCDTLGEQLFDSEFAEPGIAV